MLRPRKSNDNGPDPKIGAASFHLEVPATAAGTPDSAWLVLQVQDPRRQTRAPDDRAEEVDPAHHLEPLVVPAVPRQFVPARSLEAARELTNLLSGHVVDRDIHLLAGFAAHRVGDARDPGERIRRR